MFLSEGNGINDMKPESDYIKKINSYLKKTKNDVLLIGTKCNYIDFLTNCIGIAIPRNLYNEYKDKLNIMYSKYIGPDNDCLLSMETQTAKGVCENNDFVSHKKLDNIIHYDQPRHTEVINSIIDFVGQKLNISKRKVKTVLLHGANQRPETPN